MSVRDENCITKFRFIKKEFIKFLEENLNTKFETMSGISCPLAGFLREKTTEYCYVGKSNYYYGSSDYTDLPRWAKKFVQSVDIGEYSRKINGAEALKTFKEIDENAN